MDERVAELRRFSPDRLTHTVRRWALLVLAASAVAGLAAFLGSKAIPPEYRSTAQLYLAPASNPSASFQDVVLGQNLARSYVQLATAEVVFRPAMEKVHWDDLKSFQERTQVAQVRDTSVITVSFRDRDPQRAADAANAIADSFITKSRTLQSTLEATTISRLDEQIRSVEDDIRLLDAQIGSLRAEIDAPPPRNQSPSPSRAEAQSQLLQLDASRQAKQQTLAQLSKTRDDLGLAAARAENTVSLWQPATTPLDQESPRAGMNTLLGAMSGALVTVLVIAIAGYVDDRIKDVEEVRSRLGIAPLAQVPRSAHAESFAGKLFVRDEPTAPEAEAFRSLKTNILFANVDERPRTIVLTSALAGEGKSIVAANLALAFAEAGTPTILVDADLRRSAQHTIFRLKGNAGATSLLTGALPFSALEEFRVSPRLLVIPSGPLPPNPAELLSSGKMSALIRTLADFAEGGIVIFDTSPVLTVADPLPLAAKVDGCVLVIDSARTNARATRHAVDSLQRVHAVILGAVLNKVSRMQEYYYYEQPAARTPESTTTVGESRRSN